MVSPLHPLPKEVHRQPTDDPSEERSVLLPDGQSGDPEEKSGNSTRSPGEETDSTGNRKQIRNLPTKSASDRRREYLKATRKGNRVELSGKQVSCWTVTNGVKGYRNEILWRCVCVCGTVAFYSSWDLIYSKKRQASCGCTPDAPRFFLPNRPENQKRKDRKARRLLLIEKRRRENGEKTRLRINITYDLKEKIKEWCYKRKVSVERFLIEYIEDVIAGRRQASVPIKGQRKNWSPKKNV